MIPSKQQGTVKWFSPEKGYGFIIPNDGPDIWFHITDVEGRDVHGFKNPDAGRAVEYNIGPAKEDKVKAVEIALL